MKPLPAPEVPGKTEAERMDNAVRKMFQRLQGNAIEARSRPEALAGEEKAGTEARLISGLLSQSIGESGGHIRRMIVSNRGYVTIL